jgi:hypothetical protein
MADPTVVQGSMSARGTAGDLALRIVPEVSDEIIWLGAPIAPLLRLSRIGGKESVHDAEYSVIEDARLPRITLTNAGNLGTTDTTLTFDNANYMRPSDVWQNTRTGEQVFVASNTATTAVVVRGYGTVAGTAILDNDEWMKMGVALSHGAAAVASRQTRPTSRVNYTQTFSATTDVTEQNTHIRRYGMPEQDRQKKNTMDDFLLQIEHAFKFQQPLKELDNDSPKDTSLTHERYLTGGFKYWVDTDAAANVLDAGGTLSQDDFWDWMRTVTTDAPGDQSDGKIDYMLLASGPLVSILNKWQLQAVNPTGFSKEFGPNLSTYQTPFGKMEIMYDKTFKGTEYFNYGYLINRKYVGYRFLEGMDMKIKKNIQDPDTHQMKDEIYGTIGFYLTLPSVHGYVKNADLAA